VYVTEEEMTSLIMESDATRHVDARYGGGRVWLEDTPTNQWAFKFLVQWRGLDLSFDY
jgi:hypothetical protein